MDFPYWMTITAVEQDFCVLGETDRERDRKRGRERNREQGTYREVEIDRESAGERDGK